MSTSSPIIRAPLALADSRRKELLAVAISALWTPLFVLYRLGVYNPAGAHRIVQAVIYSWPMIVAGLAVVNRRRDAAALRLSAGWCALLVVALLSLPKLTSSPASALATPAVALALALAFRYPALMVTIAVAVSSAFGDLEVYWHFPTQKVIDLVLITLAAALVTVGLTRSSRRTAPRPLVLVLASYLFISMLMVPLASDRTTALHDFSTTGLYLLTALVIAHAGWSEATYERMARAVLLAAVAVGAYATLRQIIGPSHQEVVSNISSYHFINGRFRLIGSMRSPQDLGFWTSAMLPFTLAWSLGARGRWRVTAVLATLLLAVALYGSGLRSGLIAAAIGMLAAVFVYHRSRAFPGLRLGITAGVVLMSIATGAVLFTVVHSTTSAHNYAALLHPGQDQSVIARKAKWEEALRELQHRPFGFGMGSAYYSQSANAVVTNVGAEAIDDGYLYVALEQGMLIMGLFVAALIALLVELGRGSIKTSVGTAGMLGMGATGVLLSVAVSAVAEVPGQSPRLLVPCIAIGLGLAQFTMRRSPEDAVAVPSMPAQASVAHTATAPAFYS